MKMCAFTVAALDYFPQYDQYRAGGNAFNQAVCYAQLGWDAYFVGALGTDRAGSALEKALRSYSVRSDGLHTLAGKTASNKIRIEADGERVGIDGAWDSGVYGDFRFSETDWKLLEDADLWASHANFPEFEETLGKKKKGQFYAVDFLHLTDYELLEKSLDAVDIAFFGGTPDMAPILATIARRRDALIVLTLGSEGSIAFKGKQMFEQSALPVEKVVDTTGCGDAFQAGFCDSYYRFRDETKALRAGAESGKLAAAHLGAIQWKNGIAVDLAER
jgi:fructoselysine 6-kinase